MLNEIKGALPMLGVSGVAAGVLLAGVEKLPFNETTMMYSVAIAVIGLAGLVLKQGRGKSPVVSTAACSAQMAKVTDLSEDLAMARKDVIAIRTEITGRFDRIDGNVGKLADSIAAFRESTVGALADHRARLGGAERDISSISESIKELRT